MTIKEAVIADLQIPGYSDTAIEKAITDAGLTVSSAYTAGLKDAVRSVTIEVLQGMRAIASVSEGGYSVSYSIEGVNARLLQLGVGGTSVQAVNIW